MKPILKLIPCLALALLAGCDNGNTIWAKGRYQFATGTTQHYGGPPQSVVLKIDTHTGQAWYYFDATLFPKWIPIANE